MKTKTVTRSADTGQFVPERQARRSPSTTVHDQVPVRHQPGPTRSVVRDAGSGQFTESSRAKTAPTRTVAERVPTGGKK